MDARRRADSRKAANFFKTLSSLVRAARRQNVQFCLIGSVFPWLETKVRPITDVDLVIDGDAAAKRLFSQSVFRNGLEFNISNTPHLAQSGQYFARFNDVRMDIYTRDVAGIPVSTILENSQIHYHSGLELLTVSPDMYFILKAKISDFATSRLTGQMHKGFGRGEGAAKKDLHDLCLIYPQVNFENVEAILQGLPAETKRIVHSNLAFLKSASEKARFVARNSAVASELNRRISAKAALSPEEITIGIINRTAALHKIAPKRRA